jgi:glycerate 2-kinase
MQKSPSSLVLLIFDKFKDTLSAKTLCHTVQQAIHSYATQSTDIREIPISDGGDGFVDCMHAILKHSVKREIFINDPLMREIKSHYLIDETTKTAYVEVANSAGLPMLSRDERDPAFASSIVRFLFAVNMFDIGNWISD